MPHKLPLILIVALVLTGCAGRETDPRRAGFVNSVINQTDGTYDRRLEERRARNAYQAGVNDETAANTARLEAERARLERRVSSTRKRISSLNSRIASAKRGLARDTARYAELSRAEEKLRQEETRLDDAAARSDEDAVLVQLRRVGLIEEELSL